MTVSTSLQLKLLMDIITSELTGVQAKIKEKVPEAMFTHIS